MGQGCGRQLTSVEVVSVLVAHVFLQDNRRLTGRDDHGDDRRATDRAARQGAAAGRGPPLAALLAPTDAPGLVCNCTCYLYHGPRWTAVYYRRKALYCVATRVLRLVHSTSRRPQSSKSTIADGVQRRRRLRRAVPLFPVLTLGRAKATRRRLLHRRQKFVLRIQGEHVLARV